MKVNASLLLIALFFFGCSGPKIIVNESLETLKNAIENDPNNSVAFYNLGVGYLSNDSLHEALTCFRKSVELKPQFPLAHFAIFCTEYKLDKDLFKESIKDTPDSIYQSKIDSIQNHFRTAFLYEPFLNWQVATILLESKRSASNYYDSQFRDFYYEVFYDGFEEFFLGHSQEAIKKLSYSIDLLPMYHQARYFRGIAYAQTKNYDSALEDFKTLIDSTESDNKNKILPIYLKTADLYYMSGKAYFQQGDLENASNAYKKVLMQDMSYYMAHLQLSQIYQKKKEYDKAVQELDAAIFIAPKNSLLHYNKGVFLSNLGQFDQSIQEYKRSVELNKYFYEAYFNLGELYYYKKQFKDALDNYRAFLKVTPNFESGTISKAKTKMEELTLKGAITQ